MLLREIGCCYKKKAKGRKKEKTIEHVLNGMSFHLAANTTEVSLQSLTGFKETIANQA
jgi:hypothetical protein